MADDDGQYYGGPETAVVSPPPKKRNIASASSSFITSSPMNPSVKKLRGRPPTANGEFGNCVYRETNLYGMLVHVRPGDFSVEMRRLTLTGIAQESFP